MLVSVIMNCFNSDKYLKDAIESVYKQTYKNWEIIFYDNNSSDQSALIANSYDFQLKYFKNTTTVPLGAARNAAINNASGDLIAFLDCDDCWLEDKLQEQILLFKNNPDIGFIYGNFYFVNGDNKKRHLGFKKKQPSGDVLGSFLKYFPVNLQTVIVKKSALLNLDQLFDNSLNLAEDYDLFLRLASETRCIYQEKPQAIYRIHKNMNSIKFAEEYPDELVYCVDKIQKKYSHKLNKYQKELKYLEAKMGYWKAKEAILKGDKKQARYRLELRGVL